MKEFADYKHSDRLLSPVIRSTFEFSTTLKLHYCSVWMPSSLGISALIKCWHLWRIKLIDYNYWNMRRSTWSSMCCSSGRQAPYIKNCLRSRTSTKHQKLRSLVPERRQRRLVQWARSTPWENTRLPRRKSYVPIITYSGIPLDRPLP